MLATLCLAIASVLPSIGASETTPMQADLHLDTPHQLHAKDLSLDAAAGLEAGLSQLRAGGTNVAVMVLWPPRKADHWPHVQAVLGIDDLTLTEADRAAGSAALDEDVAQPGGPRALMSVGLPPPW